MRKGIIHSEEIDDVVRKYKYLLRELATYCIMREFQIIDEVLY